MNRYSDIDLKNKKLPPVGGYWSEALVSLEVALEPIESLINDLNRSIKMAKKHCTFPSKHDLTRDESAAVYLYTMEGGQNSFYRVLNAALRSENRPALKPWFPFLRLFDAALNKLPTVKESLWRGVPGDVSGQFPKDQVLTWWSISSCSRSVNIIQDFLGSGINSTLFMIEAVNGKDISSYSYFPNENEILLGLGTELRVKADTLKHPGGLNIVHLLELSDDVDEQLPKAIVRMDLKPEGIVRMDLKPGATARMDLEPKALVKGATGTGKLASKITSTSLAQAIIKETPVGTGHLKSKITSASPAQATIKETPVASPIMTNPRNSKPPSNQMPACPRCGRNDKVYYDSNYLGGLHGDLFGLAFDDAYDAGRARDARGHIGERTKFCFFTSIGSQKTHICDYQH